MLRVGAAILIALVSISGYPSFAWWLGHRSGPRAIVILWLLISLPAAAFIASEMWRVMVGPALLLTIPLAPLVGFGVSSLIVARRLQRDPDPPMLIPLGVLLRAVLAYLLGVAAVFALSSMLVRLWASRFQST